VNGVVVELVARGVHALRRSTLWWGVGILFFAVLNTAFWPTLEGTEALQSLEEMGEVLEAFGAQNLATPAGYHDGQVYALMLPLLLSGMAIAGASALTSGDEDAGRLELLHALPVSRHAVWLARWAGALVALTVVAVVVGAVMAVCLPVFSLDGVGVGAVVGATFGCGLLAAFHASVAFAAGGVGARRAPAVGLAILVLVAGYVVSLVLPLADALGGARRWSPWYWALGRQPVSDGVDASRLLLLVAVTAALVALGLWGVGRRDIRSA
jgi:ABC-2 type transport system permease protein